MKTAGAHKFPEVRDPCSVAFVVLAFVLHPEDGDFVCLSGCFVLLRSCYEKKKRIIYHMIREMAIKN